jgi:hypothetical protein
MRTNNLSQLNAMKYLAKKKPGTFRLLKVPFVQDRSELGWYLYEKFERPKKKTFEALVATLKFELNFRDWD